MRNTNRLARIIGVALLLATLVAAVLPSQQAFATGWLSGYTYRVQLTVPSDASAYAMKVQVNKPAAFVYYNGSATGGTGAGTLYSIGMATTNDFGAYSGFTKYAGNPIIPYAGMSFCTDKVKDQDVIQVGDQYYMYVGANATGGPMKIYVYYSGDGYNWRAITTTPALDVGAGGTWDAASVEWPRVRDTINDAGYDPTKRFRMLYMGCSAGGVWQIGYAYSANGITFTKGLNNPVIAVGAGGSWDDAGTLEPSNVVLSSGTYYVQYGGEDGSRAPQGNVRIGLVTFSDYEGVYTKYASNPVISYRRTSIGVLTAQTSVGTKTVAVADTSVFEPDEPVWLFKNDYSAYELNYVDTIDSPTQLTLVNAAATNYAGTTSSIESWMYGSLCPASIYYNGTSWVSEFTAFQPFDTTKILEYSAVATSTDGHTWIPSYSDSPPVPYDPGSATWDQTSAENPMITAENGANSIFTHAACQDDFDDVRFTQSDGTTLLDQFRASYTSGVQAEYWVEVPATTTTIYIYYGNSGASLSSDGDATFVFFDGFSGVALDGTKWDNLNSATVSVGGGNITITSSADAWRAIATKGTYSRPQRLAFRGSMVNTQNAYNGGGFAPDQTPAVNIAWFLWGNGTAVSPYTNVETGASSAYTQPAVTGNNQVHDYELRWKTNSVKFYIDDGFTQEVTTNVPTVALKGTLAVYDNPLSQLVIDWFGITNYPSADPIITAYAAEESVLAQVTTSAATSVTNISAVLNANITFAGTGVIERGFEWGLTTAYGDSWTEAAGPYSTGTYSHSIGSLTASTNYHYRASARTAEGWSYGSDVAFNSTASANPVVTTLVAVDVSGTTATIQGSLDSLGSYTPVYISFEWGTSIAYGNVTAEETKTSTTTNYHADLTGLSPGVTYHFRARVRYNVSMYAYGLDDDFITTTATPPTISTGAASAISISSATLQGTITSMGSYSAVSVYFDYGLTTGYGGTTAQVSHTTAESFTGSISSLLPGRTYHFRAVIVYTGTGSPDYGSDAQFVTLNSEDFGADRSTGDAAPSVVIDNSIPSGTSDFITNNPAAPLITAIVNAINSSGSKTTNALQIWQCVAGLLILLIVVGALLMFNHHQFVSGVAGVALFWFFVSQGVYPWWTIFIGATWLVTTVIIERAQSV